MRFMIFERSPLCTPPNDSVNQRQFSLGSPINSAAAIAVNGSTKPFRSDCSSVQSIFSSSSSAID